MSTHFPDFISNLNNLVSLPSVSSANPSIDMSNHKVIDYLATCFEDLGFSCELVASPSSSGKEKSNLIATRGTGPGGLVLSGHTDTVPLDEELWSVNPFQLTEKHNRLYGLGSTDMKGFFPVVMEAVKALGDTELREPLIILATADEETSMQGARTIAERGSPKGRFAVIGEPTGLIPVKAHKGIMMESIRLQGKSGHSSDPSLGNNALEAMHAVITDLLLFRKELRYKYQNDLFKIEYPTLNLGCIHGGDNPNRICGHCDLEIDVRLMPDMDIDNIRELITNRVAQVTGPLGIEFELVPLFPGAPAFLAKNNSEILSLVETMTGQDGITVAFSTEAPYLQKLGMDTIIFGPGNIDQAHQPDEYMSLDMVKPGIGYLKQIIENTCL
ncbi:MAG: acetylornithine deacetylase [Gammaproteobacteria bacterium]|nr:acetylornithine deacetylase [Gammaproteobacteria bacterium]